MEHTPKFKVGQKVWFVTYDSKFESGKITGIAPVSYNFLYSIKTRNDASGLNIQLNVWENDVLCDIQDNVNDVMERLGERKE